ncbi:hypothetical protein Taro_042784, partial [Colocasia esculenta]|nr:hypothetical protein [Colocasia esculenta]
MFSPPVEQDSGMGECYARMEEVLPENILICPQLCAYMYIFSKGNSAQAEVLPKLYPYIHEYCAYMYIFPKGNSAQAEVLSENISIYPQKVLFICVCFLRETLPKQRFCRKYINMFMNICSYMCIF